MNPAIERDVLAELSAAMAAYLTNVTTLGDCLERAWPEVGAAYNKRIQGLHSRLSFDVNRDAIRESSQHLQAELKDYADVVSRLQNERSVDLERGLLALREMIEALSRRQKAQGESLRALAAQLPNVSGAAKVATELSALAGQVEQDTLPTLSKMDQEAVALGKRLAGAASVDPLTGLINRGEFERQVAAYQLNGTVFSILVFRVGGPVGDQVMHQAASRLTAEFRRRDRVGRWSKNEIAVLFAGPAAKADERAVEAAARLAGPYALLNGEIVHITAEVNVLPSLDEF